MELRISRGNGGKIRVDVWDGESLVERVASGFDDNSNFDAAARKLDLPTELLKNAVASFENGGAAVVALNGVSPAVFVRSLLSSDRKTYSAATYEMAFSAALADASLPLSEPLICWDDGAINVDVDDAPNMDHAGLLAFLERFNPVPRFAWLSHRRGFKLQYFATSRLTAEQIGAIAAFNLRAIGFAQVELKNSTRHPLYGETAGSVISRTQSVDSAALRQWFGEFTASDDLVQAWLAAHDYVQGRRYPHERCPIAPGPSHGEPVVANENGIFCFRCEGTNVYGGSSKAGFFPYSHLCGESRANMLMRCIEHRCHFDHAKYILAARLNVTGKHAELLYGAALSILGKDVDTKTAKRICLAGKDVLRFAGRWANSKGDAYLKSLPNILGNLPACQSYIRGAWLPDKEKIGKFEQSHDLSQYGYHTLTPIYGCRIYSHFQELPDPERILVICQRSELSSDAMAPLRPRYRTPAERMPQKQVIDEFERVYPGLCWPLLRMLVAARGCSEGGIGMPPILFATGPTGAAKSSTVALAASITGDAHTELVYTGNIDRLRQGYRDGKDSGCYVVLNEIFKEMKRNKFSYVEALDFLLNLTPDSVSHYMYVGPVKLDRLPATILTDTYIPNAVYASQQLCRRAIHAHLPRQLFWEKTLRDAGIAEPGKFRISNEVRAEACNAVLSGVIDDFFRSPMTFEEIAVSLGFCLLQDTREAKLARETFPLFFSALCRAPALKEPDSSRWPQKGFKVISRDNASDLLEHWLQLHDEGDFTTSRRCSEVDWMATCKLREPAQLEIKPHGSTKVAVRLRSLNGNEVVNGELL